MTVADARPFLRASERSPWAVAERKADEFVAAIKEELASMNINAAVTRSPNGTHPTVVRMDAWLQAGSGMSKGRTVRRISLAITCHVLPFHEQVYVYDVGLSREGRDTVKPAQLKFSTTDARSWTRYALGKGKNPAHVGFVEAFIRGLFPSLFKDDQNKPSKEFSNGFPPPAPVVLGWVGVILLFTGVGAVLGIPMIVAAAIVSSRRKKLVAVFDKPPIEPRLPKMVDAWSTVVPQLGSQHEVVRTRLFGAVGAETVDRMQASRETYAYFGADGYVEREQLVIRLGQALVHLHVYEFRDELFVGWDANINRVRWVESAPVSTRVEDGKLVQFCSLEVGYHQTNEYDVVDLNVVTELVHRRLRDELRRILRERSIDEEIDFTIVRGARDGLVTKDESGVSGGTASGLQKLTRSLQRR